MSMAGAGSEVRGEDQVSLLPSVGDQWQLVVELRCVYRQLPFSDVKAAVAQHRSHGRVAVALAGPDMEYPHFVSCPGCP